MKSSGGTAVSAPGHLLRRSYNTHVLGAFGELIVCWMVSDCQSFHSVGKGSENNFQAWEYLRQPNQLQELCRSDTRKDSPLLVGGSVASPFPARKFPSNS